MKILFNLSLLLILFPSKYLNAQFSIGPKLGINISTAAGDDVFDDLESVVGLQFGVAGEVSISEQFAVQPEVLYFQKGSKIDFMGVETKTFLNYLEIPILVKGKFGAPDGLQFIATLGPSFGFGLGGKMKMGDEEVDFDFEDDNLSEFDLSLSIGAGAQIPVGPGNLFLDLRYLLGLTTLDNAGEFDAFNRGFGIATGFLFSIGGEE